MTSPHARRWPLYVLGTASVCVALLALEQAGTWYGHPIAGALVDPGAVVSNIGMPSWEARQLGIHFPDAIVEVDGRPLVASPGKPRALAWDEAVEDAWASGRASVLATIRSESGVRRVPLHVRPLEPPAWWVFGGSLLFAGFLYLAAGFIALWSGPRSALARAFGKLGLFTGMLVMLTFDFHTTRHLSPLFFVAFAMSPLCWPLLALRLPDDAPLLRRHAWIERAFDAVGAAGAVCFLAAYFSGRDTRTLQSVWTMLLGACFLFFAVAFTVRYVRSEGIRRARLRALVISVVPPHLGVVALTFPLRDNAAAASFACLSLFPLATAYAFIRYDLWGSRALLSRILTRIAVAMVACALAIALSAALAMQLGIPFGAAFLGAGFGGVAAAVLVVAALGLSDRHLFGSRLDYKPTVAQLSEELISITSPGEVAHAVERTIRRWLPCDLVEVVLAENRRPGVAGEDVSGIEHKVSVGAEQLVLPIAFGGVRIGSLRVGEKPGQALFTEDDVDLLQTIVNQGALALAHAHAYQELEARRREQAAAWRGERAALVETVAAEIAHEIRYPINFFRSVFERQSGLLDAEDLEIGREEVDRLERLVSGLRRLAIHRVERRAVRIADLCGKVETLLRDDLGNRRIQLAVPEEVELRCDPDQILQALVNLVANGLQAMGGEGAVGIAWSHGPKSTELVVWDTGPGFDGDPAVLFAPWYTTKPKGTGLGLAITHRFVRAHGWSITAQRRDNRTLFIITIRDEDVLISEDEGTAGGQSTKVA